MRIRITRIRTADGAVREVREKNLTPREEFINPPLGDGEVFVDSVSAFTDANWAEIDAAFAELAEARDSPDVDISDKTR